MTQEEKDLLIKDLSARLLYKVKFPFNLWNEEKQEEVNTVCTMFSVNTDGYCEALEESGHIPLEFVKPFLRPMSSMTEEEFTKLKEYSGLIYNHQLHLVSFQNGAYKCLDFYLNEAPSGAVIGVFDWLNRKMFDYRGLIEKGLALEAPEGMYNN